MSDTCPKCGAAADDYEVLRRLHLATIAHLERAEQQLSQLREQPSQVRCELVTADDAQQLLPAVRRNVRYGADVFTDAAPSYSELCLTHLHAAIDHSREYVRGIVHTNGLENFWSLLKRSLAGTYVAVAPFHLTRYTAEQAFRFNARKGNDAARFSAAMRGTIGKRLTYRELAGVEDAGFMGIR